MNTFQPTCDAEALDIHPSPENVWHRVAVVGLWTDAKRLRRDWPRVSVVGSLRTVSGIDRIVRNLLANPQIRLLVIDGKDITSGGREPVLAALRATWDRAATAWPHLAADTAEAANYGTHGSNLFQTGVRIVTAEEWKTDVQLSPMDECAHPEIPLHVLDDKDRWGPRVSLPPPAPTASTAAPAGDPGERVVGETLADAYAGVLHAALRFGRVVPTQYGGTRELLHLVSVIRDPVASLDAWRGTPETLHLGMTWSEVLDYAENDFLGTRWHDNASYGYGSRLHGIQERAADEEERRIAGIPELGPLPNQLRHVQKLLAETPGTRAAYLTPWRPTEDVGKESGRPCLVGAWFRVQQARPHQPTPANREEERLHLCVQFRSHDLYGAYVQNLAACCYWLVAWAHHLHARVGTVTCLSMSGHVYDHAMEKAEAVVASWKRPTITWDPRSQWRFEVASDPCTTCVNIMTYATNRTCPICNGTRTVNRRIRAIASEPGPEGGIVAVFEAPTAGALRVQIERSGLVTNAGHALFLGGELAAIERKL